MSSFFLDSEWSKECVGFHNDVFYQWFVIVFKFKIIIQIFNFFQ